MQTQLSQPDAFASTNSAVELLSAALDNEGHICVVAIRADGRAYQTFFQPGDYEGAVAQAMAVDQQGANAFFLYEHISRSIQQKSPERFPRALF